MSTAITNPIVLYFTGTMDYSRKKVVLKRLDQLLEGFPFLISRKTHCVQIMDEFMINSFNYTHKRRISQSHITIHIQQLRKGSLILWISYPVLKSDTIDMLYKLENINHQNKSGLKTLFRDSLSAPWSQERAEEISWTFLRLRTGISLSTLVIELDRDYDMLYIGTQVFA
jgi:hypothetical protein